MKPKDILALVLGEDRRKIIAIAVVFFSYQLWRAGEIGVASISMAALSTLLFFVFCFGGLFVFLWLVKRVALLCGVQLGDWDSARSLKDFIAIRRRRLGQLDTGRSSARGRTQFLLGLALGELGIRETDTEALRSSAAAFRDSLPVLRAAGKETKWALAQRNLAVSLFHLSHREIGTTSLAEAVGALHAAADAWKTSDNKADWAEEQFILCGILARLGRMEEGTTRLAESVAAGRAALAAEDNSEVPIADARLEINLAEALVGLGEREAGSERLEEAASMARRSLEVIDEDQDDLLDRDESIEWRAKQSGNLGVALRMLGERRDDTEMLREAVEILRSARSLRTDKNAYDRSLIQHELACALRSLGERAARPGLPAESLSASDAALGVLTRETYPFDWAVATAARANTLAALVEGAPDAATLTGAVGDLEAALAVFEQAGTPFQRRHCRADLDRVQALLERAARKGPRGAADEPSPPGPMKPRPA